MSDGVYRYGRWRSLDVDNTRRGGLRQALSGLWQGLCLMTMMFWMMMGGIFRRGGRADG